MVAVWLYFAWCGGAWAANGMPTTRDTLVYKDGDRVQGKLVEQSEGTIVFKSDRFGELRVPAADAVVIKAEKPGPTPTPIPPAPAPAAPVAPVAAEKPPVHPAETEEEERMRIWELFSPSVLTAKVRNFMGPWHGRLTFGTEVVSDIAQRSNTSLEGHLQRKWRADEVQLNGRYDFSKTDEIATSDMVKAWGQWRHDFNKQIFAQYRPTSEWNRASKVRGVDNDYVQLQQEVGVGWNFYTRPTRKARIGISQNLFDTWNSAPTLDRHTSKGLISAFEETELTLPWRMTLSQRGVWYPVRNQHDGWENRIDLNKKLTETLSAALRHEIRRHSPDGTAQDYERLKLLFGLDF